jgi:hypothetical protein
MGDVETNWCHLAAGGKFSFSFALSAIGLLTIGLGIAFYKQQEAMARWIDLDRHAAPKGLARPAAYYLN